MLISNSDDRYYDFVESANKGLKELINKEFYFYGVFNNMFKIDDMIMEALADPQDGYRSSMGTVCHIDSSEVKGRFHKRPLAKVKLITVDGQVEDDFDYSTAFYGHALVDVDTDNVWLLFGTGNSDDYYPHFMFTYRPDETQKDYITIEDDYVNFKERHPEIVLKLTDWFSGDKIQYDSY